MTCFGPCTGPSSGLKICVRGDYTVLLLLTLNQPTTTIVAQPFNVIKWQLKFNPVA